MLHVHVLLVAPLGAGHMAKPDTDQHERRIAVRETSHHTGAAADLPVQSLNDIRCYSLHLYRAIWVSYSASGSILLSISFTSPRTSFLNCLNNVLLLRHGLLSPFE